MTHEERNQAFYNKFNDWKKSDPSIEAYVKSLGQFGRVGLENMLFVFFEAGIKCEQGNSI
jgi:hypothetical protein